MKLDMDKYLKYKRKYQKQQNNRQYNSYTDISSELANLPVELVDLVNNLGMDLYSNLEGASNVFSPSVFILVLELIQLGMIDIFLKYAADKDELERLNQIIRNIPFGAISINVSNNGVGINSIFRILTKNIANFSVSNDKKIFSEMIIKPDFQYKFRKNNSVKMIFHQTDEVTMMHLFGTFQYYSDEKIQLVEMPLENTNYQFGVVLPKKYEEEDTMPFSINDAPLFTFGQINEFINNTQLRNLEIYLPKFQRNNPLELITIVEKMGYITNLDSLTHSTKIVVSESDTEIVEPKITLNTKYTLFKANHTFVYYIRYVPDNLFLIYGDYQGPQN